MKPMDNVQKWLKTADEDLLTDVLSAEERKRWNDLTTTARRQYVKDLLEKPVDFMSPVHPWYFRSKWSDALKHVHHEASIQMLEIGPGDTDMLPQTISRIYPHPQTCYVAANMNKALTAHFKEITSQLPIKIDVIEDAAQRIEEYIGIEKMDVIAFEHSINDVIQAMLGEKEGIDTTNSDWFHVLPQMIEIINRHYVNGTLESEVKDEFLGLISSCLTVLKQGAFIIINHFQYQYDLNLGMNPDLWENLLPIARGWIQQAGLGQEVFFDDFEPQWWMFIQKV